jgi:glycosyltransferase involved in cell wall biosynthesis
MRVALVLPGFSADEGDWCIPALLDMVRSLSPHCEIFVLALRYPFERKRYHVYGAQVQSLGWGQRALTRKGLGWPDALRALLAEHRRRPFDLLHAFWAGEAGFLATLVGRLIGQPALLSLAGGELVGLRDIGYGSQLMLRQRLLVRASLRGAQHVTAGSHYLHALATQHVRASKLGVQPLGTDCQRFRPDARNPAQKPPRLLHAASLLPVKDQITLLRTLALLHAWGHPATLDIAGVGPEAARLRALAAQLRLDGAIRWLGAIPHHELPAHYQAADAFVLSSRHEAQALVLTEALACGRPVVATQVGLAPELVPTSLLVPPQDHVTMASALAGLLASPGRRAGLGQEGRAQTLRDYSLEATTRGWLKLYGTLSL